LKPVNIHLEIVEMLFFKIVVSHVQRGAPELTLGLWRSLLSMLCIVDHCLSFLGVPFLLAIVLVILLRCTTTEYPFGIFRNGYANHNGDGKIFEVMTST
jgi:hypothetical protein